MSSPSWFRVVLENRNDEHDIHVIGEHLDFIAAEKCCRNWEASHYIQNLSYYCYFEEE